MISRRTLLQWSAALPVLVPAAAPARAKGWPAGLDAVLIDRRFGEARMGAALAPRVHGFDGDVTDIWFRTIDPLWRRPGFVIGGITGPDALFVLERLAWDRGRRVVDRRELPGRGSDGRSATGWVIAPVHPSVRA